MLNELMDFMAKHIKNRISLPLCNFFFMGSDRSSTGRVQNILNGERNASPPSKNELFTMHSGKFVQLFKAERYIQRTIIYQDGCNAPVGRY